MDTVDSAAQPSVLVFDANETLIDIDSIATFFGELFGDEKVLREWFGQLVMYSMATTLACCVCWPTSTGWTSPTTTSRGCGNRCGRCQHTPMRLKGSPHCATTGFVWPR